MSCEDTKLSEKRLKTARACPKCRVKKHIRFYTCCGAIYVHCINCLNRGAAANWFCPDKAIKNWNLVAEIAR